MGPMKIVELRLQQSGAHPIHPRHESFLPPGRHVLANPSALDLSGRAALGFRSNVSQRLAPAPRPAFTGPNFIPARAVESGAETR
jgi:hypothetical protein